METPDWLHWLSVSSVKLEDCVSISLNCQPVAKQHIWEDEKSRGVKWDITPHCITDGIPNGPDRLYRLRKYFDTRPDLLPPIVLQGKDDKRVRLLDFVRFAHSLDWSMPPKLMALLHSTDVTTTGQATQPDGQGAEAAQHEPKTKQQATSPIFSTPRRVLIQRHSHHWPTIDRDIKDASTNGLHKAKAGKREWYENIALDWAAANGKLTDEAQPTKELHTVMANWGATLPSRKNKLEG